MALHIPIAIDFFYDYLRSKHNPDGIHWIALHIDLRLYDSNWQNEDSTTEEILEMAQKIRQEYLEDGAEYQVDLDMETRSAFEEKFSEIEQAGAQDEPGFDLLFIEVYAFVLDKLREYYELFKRSNAFLQLENEIRMKERLYEILVEANLITN